MEHTSFAPMDDKHLGQFGENTARAMRAEGNMRGRAVWRDTLGQLREIRRVRVRISARRGPEEGAAEWLLDNWYLAQREGRNGAEAFRRVRCIRYVLRGGRVPLIMELARAFVRAAGKEAGPERLAIFLERAQEGQALTEQELSLLIPALKCALTERLATLCRELEHLELSLIHISKHSGSGRTPGTMRATASATTMAGSSPPVSTKSPMESSSSTQASINRSSIPS